MDKEEKIEVIGEFTGNCDSCKTITKLYCFVDCKTNKSLNYCRDCIKDIYNIDLFKKKRNEISIKEGRDLIQKQKRADLIRCLK